MEEAAAAVYVVEQTSGLVRRTHASSYLILFYAAVNKLQQQGKYH